MIEICEKKEVESFEEKLDSSTFAKSDKSLSIESDIREDPDNYALKIFRDPRRALQELNIPNDLEDLYIELCFRTGNQYLERISEEEMSDEITKMYAQIMGDRVLRGILKKHPQYQEELLGGLNSNESKPKDQNILPHLSLNPYQRYPLQIIDRVLMGRLLGYYILQPRVEEKKFIENTLDREEGFAIDIKKYCDKVSLFENEILNIEKYEELFSKVFTSFIEILLMDEDKQVRSSSEFLSKVFNLDYMLINNGYKRKDLEEKLYSMLDDVALKYFIARGEEDFFSVLIGYEDDNRSQKFVTFLNSLILKFKEDISYKDFM